MTTIKIKSTYLGIIVMDDLGIVAYDQYFKKKTFNLVFQDGYFVISPGYNYNSYYWGTDYELETLKVQGSCIYHVNMAMHSQFHLTQEYQTTVHLYNKLDKMIVFTVGGILISDFDVKRLHVNSYHGTIKGFNVTDQLSIVANEHSCINIRSSGVRSLQVDATSEVIINQIKVKNTNIGARL